MRHERRRLHLLAEQTLVVVFHAQAPLGVDDSTLALDDRRDEGQVSHAVGLEIEHEIQGATGKPVLVAGDVRRS